MSTPPGKPVGPIDLSAFVSQKAREIAATERESVENDNTHLDSPYAPKSHCQRGGSGPPPAAGGPDKQPFTERDVERLESSLRWLQREEEATRLLRTTRPPATRPANSADDFGHASPRRLQSPRSLEPEHLVPPPELSSGRGRWPLAVMLASAFGAGVAYYFAAGDAVPPSTTPPRPQVTSSDNKANANPGANSVAKTSAPPAPVVLDRQALFPAIARDDDVAASSSTELSARAKTSRMAKSPEAPTASPPQPADVEAAPASKAARTLDPEEIKLLIKQGDQFVAAGDLVTARVVFQRAAEAGDASAAMALAATYDPGMLAKLGVVGVSGDVEKARAWYQKAEILGSPEATRRLGLLANR
jgi:hypothetical protein